MLHVCKFLLILTIPTLPVMIFGSSTNYWVCECFFFLTFSSILLVVTWLLALGSKLQRQLSSGLLLNLPVLLGYSWGGRLSRYLCCLPFLYRCLAYTHKYFVGAWSWGRYRHIMRWAIICES